MKIVIDIDEEEYEKIKAYTAPMVWAEHLIKNGTPLPKCHGDLKDASQICPDYGYCEDCHCGTECPVRSENIIIPADEKKDK